jgi:hypothetical protein
MNHLILKILGISGMLFTIVGWTVLVCKRAKQMRKGE